ncbi:MAG TPA: cobyrinate a,c-diamide synthase [Thiohalobacter sp.]|nr:cobyrinate a,c-diamide synthase [Thiohalobacter sp.]
MSTAHCPALLVSAPASGQGKTTVTAALARRARNRGLAVRCFKTGPDFIDPLILERASGAPVYQLDLWMTGEAECRARLHAAAVEADLILIEGVMGLFDGAPASAADLAERFELPVLAVIDAGAMAQTFGALAHGLAHYRPGLPFAGVLANRVAGAGHLAMLREALPAGMAWHGALPRDPGCALPERHLGLVLAEELEDLDARLDAAAQALEESGPDDPAPVAFQSETLPAVESLLAGRRIAIARDAAFAFLYPANLDLLRAMGAELRFFSPLAGDGLPECDALWLPGGYPELHLRQLSENTGLKADIRAHHGAGRPILAECGGMLYLLEELADASGETAAMTGLLPGRARLTEGVRGLGLQSAELPGGEIRGHTFHHTVMETDLTPAGHAVRKRGGQPGEPIHRQGRLLASYLHWYFPSNPEAAARLFPS